MKHGNFYEARKLLARRDPQARLAYQSRSFDSKTQVEAWARALEAT
jgi:hypothetical protein